MYTVLTWVYQESRNGGGPYKKEQSVLAVNEGCQVSYQWKMRVAKPCNPLVTITNSSACVSLEQTVLVTLNTLLLTGLFMERMAPVHSWDEKARITQLCPTKQSQCLAYDLPTHELSSYMKILWQHAPVILTLGNLRQEDEFEVSLGYKVRACLKRFKKLSIAYTNMYINPVESNQCCPQAHEQKAVHCSSNNLLGATLFEKADSFPSSC